MVERNDELLEDLRVAQRLIQGMEKLNIKRRQVHTSYLPTDVKYKKLWKGFQPVGWKLSLTFIFTIVLSIILARFKSIQIWLIVTAGLDETTMWTFLCAIEIIIAVVIVRGIQPIINKRIQKHNRSIGERAEANKIHNTNIYQSCEAPIIEQQEVIANQFNTYCSRYPKHYCNSDAVTFFVKVVESGQALSFNQVADRYEIELEKRRQIQRENKIDKMNRDHQKVMEIEGAFTAFAAMSVASSANRTANAVEIHNAVYHKHY